MKLLVLDTETLGIQNRLIYDLGYLIYDTETETILVKRDYIIKQVYDNNAYMQSAYYGWKKPLYEKMLADGLCKKVYLGVALDILRKDIERYTADGTKLFAYNSKFDKSAIADSCSKFNMKQNPTSDGIIDIMDYISPITQTEDYKRFCMENGFMTKHSTPRPQQKAETLFRYLSGQTDFVEKHMALNDSEIELEILLKVWDL